MLSNLIITEGGDKSPLSLGEVSGGAMYDWSEYTNAIRIAGIRVGVHHDELEDLTQDALLQLMRLNPEDTTNPGGMAYKVGHDMAVNHVRQSANRDRLAYKHLDVGDESYGQDTSGTVGKGTEALPLEVLSKGVSPETLAQSRDLLSRALATLTPDQYDAIVLIDVLGYTYQEAAAEVGISRQAFHRRHQRARKGIERWKRSV